MTLHMFKVFIGRGSMNLTDLETRVQDWLEQNACWQSDPDTHGLKTRNTGIDDTGETYFCLRVRFAEDDTKSNLLQKLTDKLKDKVAWYRVGYHTCGHDGTGGACAWSDSVEWTAKDVTIPSGVPMF